MRYLLVLVAFGVVAVLSCSAAQEAMGMEGVGLKVGTHESQGEYLTDQEGRALYLFLSDRQSEEGEVYGPGEDIAPSTCYDQCAQNWPPFVVEEWPLEEGAVGEGLDEDVLAMVEREDGSIQVAYNGWPLYYFARDEAAGDTNGQGLGDVWYLVSPEGEAVGREQQEASEDEADSAEQESAEGQDDGELLAQLTDMGEDLYQRTAQPECASCHGEDGGGENAPALEDSRIVANADRLIRKILNGSQFMPSFGGQLSDQQIAAVATYVRTSFGNDHGLVTEEEVSAQR